MDVTGDGSKVQCYKKQYSIGTWNVMFMNQGKFLISCLSKSKFLLILGYSVPIKENKRQYTQ